MEKRSQLLTAFLEDLEQALEDFDQAILNLEKSPENSVDQIFRIFHSIKASTKILSFDHFAKFTHEAETFLSGVRKGEVPLDERLMEFFFELYDLLKSFRDKVVAGYQESDFLKNHSWQEAVTRYHEILSQGLASLAPPADNPTALHLYQISLHFDPDIFLTGADPRIYLEELMEKTSVLSCRPKTRSIPPLEELNPLQYYIQWELEVETPLSMKELKEIFAFLDESKNQILIQEKHKHPPASPQKVAPGNEIDPGEMKLSEFVRVPVHKLDDLLNLFGELVIGFSQVETGISLEVKNPESLGAVENLSRILKNLQFQIMNIRMVSVAPLFNQFHRFVLESSKMLGKKARLEIRGEETELDKNMINQIGEPLKHLVRNSLDHGLETESERVSAGKEPEGTILLSAQCREDGVYIEVSDDGKGLDSEKILKKALEKNLISEEASKNLKTEQIYEFLFQPGFSTRETISEFSGRGVGLDVVKNRVEAVRGSIEIQTEKNRGTSFLLRLPLTLSIIDTVTFRIGKDKFAVPIFNIRELVKLKEIQEEVLENRISMLKLREAYYPVFRLNQFFPECVYDSEDFLQGYLILLELDNKKFFLLTDEILGEQQTVIKGMPLLEKYKNGLLGTSISGTGDIIFILDIYTLTNKLIREMEFDRKGETIEKESHST